MRKRNYLKREIWERIPVKYSSAIMLTSLFLFLQTLIIKMFMLKDAGSYSHFLDVFRVARADIVFLLIISLIFIVVALLSRGFYIGLKIAFVVIAFIYSISMIAQAMLFKTTGFGITREYIQNFLHNLGEDLRMILSELAWAHWLGLGAVLILIIFLARLPYSSWFNRLVQRFSKRSDQSLKKAAIVIMLTFFLFLESLALLPGLEDVHPAIKQVSVLELVSGFWPENEAEEAMAIELLPEERLDNPIILQPGREFQPRNIVLIIIESLSWKYCDVYNPGLGATPFLAELAKKSLVVERLYTVDPHTSKALIPIIGGIYPFPEPAVLEAKPGILPEKALPHILKKLGYRSAFFQTANNYEDRPGLVANLGYDLFRGLYHLPQEGFAYVNYFGREEMMMLGPSLEWIEKAPGQPFLLTYLTLSTHHEYGYPPDFPATNFDVKNENQNRYLNALRYTDSFIRKLFDEFKKRNLDNKTIFIILGDHGEAFGEHGLSGHNYTLWEEGLRVPGIIYAPGIFKESGTIEGFRSILDIVPTVCEFLGLDLKEGNFIGKSLLSPADDNRELFFTGWTKSRIMGYRKGRKKFLFPSWSSGAEIYDNLIDLDDKHNLFGLSDEIRAEAVDHRERTRKWWESVAVQYRQWERKAEPEFKSSRPEEFANRIEASIDSLVTIYGYGYFPDKTEPGRTVYINIGLKCNNKVKRPLQLKVILRPEQMDRTADFSLTPRLPLENLQPGEYVSAETIIAVPSDWPFGISRLYMGVMDEKDTSFLKPSGFGFEAREDGIIFLGVLNIFSADDAKK